MTESPRLPQASRVAWHAYLVAPFPSLARRAAIVTILLAVATASAACSAGTSEAPPAGHSLQPTIPATATSAPYSSRPMSEAEALSRRHEHLTEQAATAGLDVEALPALIRWTSPQDYGAALAACLTEAGFPATAETGGASLELSPSQTNAFWQAHVECDAKYSQHSYYTDVRPSPAALAALYESAKDATACLAEHGQPVPELPSLEVFNGRYFGTDPVLPWSEIDKQDSQSRTALKRLEQQCSRTPDMTKYLEHNPVPVQ